MITSKDNPRVKQVCAYQKKKKERDRDGVFVAEGERLVREVPEKALVSLFVSKSFLAGADARTSRFLKKNAYITQAVSDEVFQKMSDVETPQGILAVVKMRPEGKKSKKLQARWPKKGIYLLLDNIQDYGNLGTIFRSAEAAGVCHVYLSADTADIYNPKAVRATMGAVFRVPFTVCEDLAHTVRTLRKKHRVRVFAARIAKDTVPYDAINANASPVAFVIGNEGAGVSKRVASECSDSVCIPMSGSTESLNAAVAASVLVFEAKRQHRMRVV